MDEMLRRDWDLVVTVCDDALDACPVLPPGTSFVHWAMTDPSRIQGSEEVRRAAFRETARRLGDRVRSLIATQGVSS
jgi:arsenate reductase